MILFRGQNELVPKGLLGLHDLCGLLLWANLILYLQLLLLNFRPLDYFIFNSLFRYVSALLDFKIADLLVHISSAIFILSLFLFESPEAKRRPHLNIGVLPQGRDLDRPLVEVVFWRNSRQPAVQIMERFILVQVEFGHNLLLHVSQ